MAKKTSRKMTTRKSAKSAAATKGGRSAKQAAAKKPARAGGSRVSFGVHGMARIMKAVHEAGLANQFDEAMGHDDKFVKVQRKSLTKIKEFITSEPKLAGFAKEMQRCDCDPSDPYCIYI